MYIPLYNKSNYNLLSSLLKIDDIVDYAKTNQLPSISIADSNMFGTMEFIKKCEKVSIKPVIGLELNLDEFTVVTYAKDYQGYLNLIKLSTIQNERKVTIDDLKNHNKNTITVLPFQYKESFETLKSIYEELYLGYTNKKEEQESLLFTKNVIFYRKALYLNKKDEYILPYLYRIRDGKTITDEIEYDTKDYELNIVDIYELTDNVGLINTNKLADNCNLQFPKAENLLPIYECSDPKQYLYELCRVGINKRLNGNVPKNYQERLIKELKIINEMGFANYFLVVYDFIKYAKKNKILVGPGRGSAAGSLVA